MIYCSVLRGFEGEPVLVEVDLKNGIPSTIVTGLPRGAVLESVDRIKASIRNSGFSYPYERVLINLSPAGITKSGTSFDLAIACAILNKIGEFECDGRSILALGELQLSGLLLPVDGLLNAILSLRDSMDLIIIPPNSVKQTFLDDNKIVEANSLLQAIEIIQKTKNGKSYSTNKCLSHKSNKLERNFYTDYNIDISYLDNCFLSKELIACAAISAISGAHTLLFGPPGTGKSFMGNLIYSLVPDLKIDDQFSVSKIHSAAGIYSKNGIFKEAPFRQPHHSASVEGVVGGGKKSSPGEISFAHKGVLFLDEAPEFKPTILQALREPLENGVISISRVNEKWVYPADFQAILSMNLCPCGQYGRAGGICICSVKDIVRYWNRIGGALFDRIAIRIPFSSDDKSRPIEGGGHSIIKLKKKNIRKSPFKSN